MSKKCFKDVTGFDDRMLIAAGMPVAGLLISLLLFNEHYVQGDWRFLMLCIPMSFVYTGAFWFMMRWSYYHLKMRYPTFQEIGKRAFWLFLAFLGVFVFVNFVLDGLFSLLFPALHDPPNLFVEFIASMLMCTLVITIYEALSFYLQLQQAVSEKNELERQQVETQLEGLRSQVNPHFLFNSLNTLTYLIPEAPDKAVRFVRQLSKVYRYVLESRDDKVIPLQTELEFLQAYIFLLRERFGDNLNVQIRGLEQERTVAIVPLTLQLLFENVIKHNVLSTEKPLTIEVFIEKGRLIVRNNLQRKNQVMDSTGVGLDNIRSRYRLLTDQEVEVIVSQQYFTVVLPLISMAVA